MCGGIHWISTLALWLCACLIPRLHSKSCMCWSASCWTRDSSSPFRDGWRLSRWTGCDSVRRCFNERAVSIKTIKIEKDDPQKSMSSASGAILYHAAWPVTSSTSGSYRPSAALVRRVVQTTLGLAVSLERLKCTSGSPTGLEPSTGHNNDHVFRRNHANDNLGRVNHEETATKSWKLQSDTA